MKKLFTILSLALLLSFSAKAGKELSNDFVNPNSRISSTTVLKTVSQAIGLEKNVKALTWTCIEVQLSCTCGSMCGDFESAYQVAYWIAYWQGVLCGYEEELPQ